MYIDKIQRARETKKAWEELSELLIRLKHTPPTINAVQEILMEFVGQNKWVKYGCSQKDVCEELLAVTLPIMVKRALREAAEAMNKALE